MNIQDILPVMQLTLTFCNICILGYAFVKFMGKPRNDIEARITTLEHEVREIRASLHQGNDRFREIGKVNEVLIHSVLALIDFEVHYCETEQKPISKSLEKAKDDLHDYFAKNRNIE